MTTLKYYARTKEGRPPEEWQELEEHLKNAAKIAQVAFLAHRRF